LYRLNVISLFMPSLKERREDILPLAEFFLALQSKTGTTKRLTEAAKHSLMTYDWPGNIRELKHVIERASILSRGNEIDATDLHLTNTQSSGQPASLSIDEMEKVHIEKVLGMFKGNRKLTAEALGISQKTLYLKIKEYGIKVPE
jgi:DNA-binding NtrC family response regulator